MAPVLAKLNWATILLILFLPSLLMSIGPIKQLLTPKTSSPGWFHKAVMGVLAASVAKIHLALFENMFLEQGKLERVLKMKGSQPVPTQDPTQAQD